MDAEELADKWDVVVDRYLRGEDYFAQDSDLERWSRSYAGKGDGEVEFDCLPEPYIGPMRTTPKFVALGLNPGRANHAFQKRNGTHSDEIRAFGSYSAWAATAPYSREPWSAAMKGVSPYTKARVRFAQDWTDNSAIEATDLLIVELYPWHSTKVTAAMRPPEDLLRAWVWEPLASLGVTNVFAFGAPWFRVLQRSSDAVLIAELGAGGVPYGSDVPSRAVHVYRIGSRLTAVVERHSGSAGPPSRGETAILRDAVEALGV